MLKISTVVGMTEEAAIAKIGAEGFDSRVVARDGQTFIGTSDFRMNRVNLTITEGVVVHADIG